MKYSLRKLKNRTMLKRHKYPSQVCIKHQILLDPQLQPLEFFGFH